MENILLVKEYNPKLCDFGFTSFNSNELKGNLGTICHKAPEILLNRIYNGFKIDILV